MKIRFRGQNCPIQLTKYAHGNPALLILDEESGQRIAVASVNLPRGQVGEGEIAIKDWSENEGMLAALIEAGVVSQPLREVLSGFVKIPICTLLMKHRTQGVRGQGRGQDRLTIKQHMLKLRNDPANLHRYLGYLDRLAAARCRARRSVELNAPGLVQ